MLTPERRAELRRTLDVLIPARYTALTVLTAELLALLDAADERDRLAAQVERVRALLDEPGGFFYRDIRRALDGADDE